MGSHIRTVSCETTIDLFLITVINRTIVDQMLEVSAWECLKEALKSTEYKSQLMII